MVLKMEFVVCQRVLGDISAVVGIYKNSPKKHEFCMRAGKKLAIYNIRINDNYCEGSFYKSYFFVREQIEKIRKVLEKDLNDRLLNE